MSRGEGLIFYFIIVYPIKLIIRGIKYIINWFKALGKIFRKKEENL